MVSAGPDGDIWVARTGSITKLTTSGVVKGTFTDASIDTPGPMVTGSDGNLWFVNSPIHGSFSIGTVTLAGVVSSFTDPSIVQPYDLVAGPDGALWYLNADVAPTVGTDHHRRGGVELLRSELLGAHQPHGGSRRQPLVHRRRQQLDRHHHHRRCGDRLHRPERGSTLLDRRRARG